METAKCVVFVLCIMSLQLLNGQSLDDNDSYDYTENGELSTCKRKKLTNLSAPSGMYTLFTKGGNLVQAYCEMGLNGGGYTFLTPQSLTYLTNAEIQAMFTDRTSFLLRARKTDGTQPYAVLKQLPQYANIPLKLGLSQHDGYNAPININRIGQPYLYFGFLPLLNARSNSVQGLQVNGFSNTFTNCDKRPNSHITLFTNFREASPSTYSSNGAFCNTIWSKLLPSPSGRVMPREQFMFGETHWGGCGCYTQTNQIAGIQSLSIGFR